MKHWKQMITLVMIGSILCYGGLWLSLQQENKQDARAYRVDIERLTNALSQSSIDDIDQSNYPSIKAIQVLQDQEEIKFFEGDHDDYVIRYINGQYVRIEYENFKHKASLTPYHFMAALMINCVLLLLLYWYIKARILTPYASIAQLPYELAKGNLNNPLPAQNDQDLHHFLWGLDVLREELEHAKQKEYELQKEKKTLILSISHDIKTPLSSIKLYASALSKHLYDDPKKLQEIANDIQQKTKEIETFVAQIITASKEDFLELTVPAGEFYYDDFMNQIVQYYDEKLQLLKIPFQVERLQNCLLKGDLTYAIEAMQNVIENAIKYGDGTYIKLTTQEEEECRLIQVTNHGCTLSQHESAHIFDSFYRGSNTSNITGSGLGLYIAKTIMQQMDGSVFASIHEDTITITLVFRKF